MGFAYKIYCLPGDRNSGYSDCYLYPSVALSFPFLAEWNVPAESITSSSWGEKIDLRDSDYRP